MLRRAWRRLWGAPVFTVFAVVSLALGVGVTTAIYSVILSITRNGLSVPNGGSIGLVVASDPYDARRLAWRSVVSRADLEDLRGSLDRPESLAVSAPFSQSLVAGPISEFVLGEAVSGRYFEFFDVTPAEGRVIQPADDAAPDRIAVIGHQFWQNRLGGDPHVVGTTVRLGGEPFEVVGVAPEGFGGLTDRLMPDTAVWVPFGSTSLFPSVASPPRDPGDRRRRQLSVLVALPDGSLPAVSAAVAAVGARLDAAVPIDMRRAGATQPLRQPRSWSVRTVTAIGRDTDARLATVESIAMSLVALVLVVACTNLANLVLARGAARQHELAVRRTLGASRPRLVGELLAESALVTAMATIGALVVARVLIVWFASAELPVSQAQVVRLDPRLDLTTLALAALSMLASLVVFGVAPAWQLTRAPLRPALAEEGGSTGQLRWRTRRGLIAGQVMISLSFFLMMAFGVRVVLAERSQPSGIDVDRLALGMFNFHLPPWNEALAREAIGNVMALAPSQPRLDSVAVVSGMPFGLPGTPIASVTTTDRPFRPGRDDYVNAPLLASTPSVFATLGVPIVEGRPFDERDTPATEPVAVVSELLARQLFGRSAAVGRQIQLRNGVNMADETSVSTLTVVGVARDTDTQQRLSRDAGAVYLPLVQHYEPLLVMVGRAAGDPADIIEPLRTLAQRADPDLVVDRPGTAAMVLTGAYALTGTVSQVAGGLAVLAMILAMAGLFGVLSQVVSRRRREMGLRMALGAGPGQIRRLVLIDGMRPVASGVTLGLLLGAAARALLRTAYNSPWTSTDVLVFVLAPVPIVLAAWVACYWPARRAARVDPNIALRDL